MLLGRLETEWLGDLVSEGLLFVSFFWTCFHSLSSPTLGTWPGEGFYLPDPCELTFANTLLLSIDSFGFSLSKNLARFRNPSLSRVNMISSPIKVSCIYGLVILTP